MQRNDERGIAMVVALFMVLITSVVGASLMTVAQTETLSTQNYRMMSQARYAAESGVHVAANYLMHTYTPPAGGATDDIGVYDLTVSPVRRLDTGAVVTLSSLNPASSTYPLSSVKDAFANTAAGNFDLGDARVHYGAVATLRAMRRFPDATTGALVTLQTWDIVGEGSIPIGARTATVEVASTMERQTAPVFGYAAFATHDGCGAMKFQGGAQTNSYDSADPTRDSHGYPVTTDGFGNVGTNGNLTEVGDPTKINGSLSTPRQGVGNCGTNNVTAFTGNLSGLGGGINKLSQKIDYPTPPAPDPAPPTGNYNLNGGCGSFPNCSVSGSTMTFKPGPPSTVIRMPDVSMNSNMDVHLQPGIYVMNSFSQNGSSRLFIDPPDNPMNAGPVIIRLAGEGVNTVLKINGGGIENTTYDPQKLQFFYHGEKELILAGGEKTSGLFYAPNADAKFSGGSDVYGAVVVKYLSETGGAAIHYDRRLQNSGFMPGNFMLSAFTWKTY